MANENSIVAIHRTPFNRRSDVDKKKLKEMGPDRPDLKLEQISTDRGRTYKRSFSSSLYANRSWLAGCAVSNAFFCFPCLLFQCTGTEILWTTTGMRDLKHFTQKCKKHESSRCHLTNSMKLSLFGRLSIAEQLDEGYRIGIRKHNEEVRKNRHILSRIIDCIKFCGAFELALRGHDESESSDNPGIFRGLVDVVASLDGALKDDLDSATVFKGTSKTVQNELLDCMLAVVREKIISEIQSSDFLSIQADETTDISTQTQLVLVLRYLNGANLEERFFEFIPLQSATAATIAMALKERLAAILPGEQKVKLICQAYDGASVMRGTSSGVQKRIQDDYPTAHYIHCYAHQLNLIMQQATSHIVKVKNFFSDLGGLAAFFSRSPKRTVVLDKTVARRLPTASNVRWNFHSRAVNTVFEHRDDLIDCFERIRASDGFDDKTSHEAGGHIRLLEDPDFNFFLKLFHRIMPHVDILYAKLQNRNIDSVYINRCIQQFQEDIQKIRDSVHAMVVEHRSGSEQPRKRRAIDQDELKRIATEVCDTILGHTKERFAFKDHLISATLLDSPQFDHYLDAFPEVALATTLKAYPVLDGSRLKTELTLIYGSEEFRTCRGAVDLYQLFKDNNLSEVFSETETLLKIIITTPMATAEAERCFSTLKRVKTFLRNTMTQDRLNALAMLSMEKRLVTDMIDFNQKVIERFASLKERRAKFLYK
ncbi:zinc finger MYM-type protein 1-like [Platichthys flesus]|uniref:zinc finger MYM-type protein 1-like n=1 Tax=Platichthys flesus TaxID=8260 RepID=UPI002DBF9FD9|nr:zinc finger MYM-type protein 1-like [Platichthys flesus]